MDIDVTLTTIREQLAAFYALTDRDEYSDAEYDENTLVDAVASLDEWISRGGHLPSDWNPKRRPN